MGNYESSAAWKKDEVHQVDTHNHGAPGREVGQSARAQAAQNHPEGWIVQTTY